MQGLGEAGAHHVFDFNGALPHGFMTFTVQHGEEVVGPERAVARSPVAVGDVGQRRQPCADGIDPVIVNVPDRHAIGDEAQCVVVGDDADAADDALLQQRPQALDHLILGDAEALRHGPVGLALDGEAGLGGVD